ncbi:MAG: hypothetical protein JSV85_07955 [Candidatus Bathyarchaeota archaeon]|nr:MAG: hypothetical protein JSV85_07955 [Candidatus Bathyarchaeota archaeon]
MNESKLLMKQFESEPNKTVTLIKLGNVVIKTECCDVVPGEFPITEWRSFPLEIPSSSFKQYILGRFPGSSEMRLVEDGSEVINLPVYTGEDVCDARTFEEFSSDPEKMKAMAKVSVVTIAAKTCGQYPDGRQIQSLSVLPVWSDGTSMVLELEWSEGNPAEDAINPEWFIQASQRLPVKEGFKKLKMCSKLSPIVEGCSHYLYINPSLLGTHVLGEGKEHSSEIWRREWKFNKCEKLLTAINRLAKSIT